MIFLQKNHNFDPLNRTALDDAVVITKLEATILTVDSKIQSKRRELEIPPQSLFKTFDIYSSLALSMPNEMGMDEYMDEEQDDGEKRPSKNFMVSESSKDENYASVSESRPTEEALFESVSTGKKSPSKVHSNSPPHEQASSFPGEQESTQPEVSLTTMDEVVKSMTDFYISGDWSKHMDEDQETGPKSPVPETVAQNEEKSQHTSSPPLQKNSLILSPLFKESKTPKDVYSVLHVQEVTSGAADKDDEQMHTVNDDDTKSSSSSDDSRPSTEPNAVFERFDEVNSLLDKVRLLTVEFDAHLTASSVAIANLRPVMVRNVIDLQSDSNRVFLSSNPPGSIPMTP